MKTLTSIVAVNRDGAIGCQNQLPWRLKTDLKFFKAQTLNNVVVMGRKTYDSIGGCLPNRDNIILSHNNVLFQDTPECRLSLSIPEVLYITSRIRSKDIYVVGGASTYEQFAPYVDRYLVTVVDKHIIGADAFLSEAVFGDISDWNVNLIAEHPAIDGVDEAPFAIYEWTAKNAPERKSLRETVASHYAERINHTRKLGAKSNQSANKTSLTDSLELQF